ncbi:MAG: PaaI family thioesterase [Gammaproteobacteria bacterium]|nr:PaaI family thioesterase [Gammaproteobacteria bacterium]
MLDESPFMSFAGIEVVHVDNEALELTVKMPMRPEFERRAGTGQWHGGPIASLIDVVGDYALVLQTGGGVPTINFRTDYLRPGINTALTATAKVRRAGRTVGVVDIDVLDDTGRLLAVGRGCYAMTVG